MSNRFKMIFIVRSFGYVMFLLGVSGLIVFFAPILHAEIQYRIDLSRGVHRVISPDLTSRDSKDSVGLPAARLPAGQGSQGFENLQAEVGEVINPVSTDFGIVIEKIDANARVVGNVDSSNEGEYTKALQSGVAHAKGTSLPGEVGNMYLFSHSTDAPWNIIRYNAVFYLLRELQPRDKVVILYQGRRYNYVVFDKRVVEAFDTTYLTNKYDKPILTLQTCDPPGTLWKRLIVRAKLEGS